MYKYIAVLAQHNEIPSIEQQYKRIGYTMISSRKLDNSNWLLEFLIDD